jgi:GNAT superfamily N-acetyltransferase
LDIQVRRTEYQDVERLRELYRQEANCQIVRDSALSRGFADPYLILLDGRLAGYASVGNRYDVGALLEFYTFPYMRSFALTLFLEVLMVSRATAIQAQTNMPLMLRLLYDCAKNITTDAILFEDAFTTRLLPADTIFRQVLAEETSKVFQHLSEPVGKWAIETGGSIVATGGYFTHYNPPYGDIYMEVAEGARQQGFGSYLVQELKRICYEAGKKPAARTGSDNVASRRTLEKAGFAVCGRLLVGEVNLSD